tara:strand:+ start:169 stop:597 length:429 start_codon:yes stop_codon:yes gene_type:complete
MTFKSITTSVALVLISFNIFAQHHTDTNTEAMVYIVSPYDNETVSNPVKIKFGLKGMKLSPAGIDEPNSGHHHLLIDLDILPNLTRPIPSDKNHIHFGKGQASAELIFEPGMHTLQLLFADFLHKPHSRPIISKKIKIFVKE